MKPVTRIALIAGYDQPFVIRLQILVDRQATSIEVKVGTDCYLGPDRPLGRPVLVALGRSSSYLGAGQNPYDGSCGEQAVGLG